jgi:hypothetical protein
VQIVVTFDQDIERAQPHFIVMAARVQRVEIGDAINAQHYGLAVDNEPPPPVLQRSLDNPRSSRSRHARSAASGRNL